MNEFQEHIGVGQPSRMVLRKRGTSRTTPVIRETGRTRGSVGGKKTEHWDGRIDAAVTPAPLHATVSKSAGLVNIES